MCKGMEDWLQRRENEGLERGRSEGLEYGRNETIKALIETCQELGISQKEVLAKMKEKLEIPQEEAEIHES